MKTILVVDDETSLLEMITDVLEEEGHRVITAMNGQEGLAALIRQRPDLIICDVMMPVMDGVEMCRTMQANPAYAGIPVLMISAAREGRIKDQCAYQGFLSKPFGLDALLEALERLL
ncbi:MAG TPA: response regulator [Herpetosiphonaceae bacterium]